jgi:transcriptional regulator NrdR family protein
MGDLMSEPINMTHLNQMRSATRDMQNSAKAMKIENDRLETLIDRIESALRSRGGRPAKEDAA